MKKGYRHALHWLGIATLLSLLFGLIFGYLNGDYIRSLVIAFSISYTIWFLNGLLHVFVMPRIEAFPREKKLRIEIPCFGATSLLGFLIPMFVFSRVFGFDFVGKTLLFNLGLLAFLFVFISGLIYSFQFYRELKERETLEEKLKTLAAEAKLKSLKAQINPHFLFNALNSINALVTQNPKMARKIIGRLSELLRISLEGREKTLVPLHEELEFAHLYLEVERIRFGDRMDFQEEIDPKLLSVSFPAMVLQPLLENAVKHGIAQKRGGGHVRLVLKRRNDHLECLLSNSVAENHAKQNLSRNGTGLQNIRQRLDLLYDGNYDLRTEYSDSGDFKVHLVIPTIIHEKN